MIDAGYMDMATKSFILLRRGREGHQLFQDGRLLEEFLTFEEGIEKAEAIAKQFQDIRRITEVGIHNTGQVVVRSVSPYRFYFQAEQPHDPHPDTGSLPESRL